MHHRIRARAAGVTGLVLALLTAGTGTPTAAAAPASAASLPAATPVPTTQLTVQLSPGWLPVGYVAQPTATAHVPAPSGVGTVTLTETRYVVPAPDGQPLRDVLYFEVRRGGSLALSGDGENAQPTMLAGRPAQFVDGAVREFRMLLDDMAAGVVATIGAHGAIADEELRRVAETVVKTPVPAEEPPAIVAVVPGDSTTSNTNMKGTGYLYNDWSTDGSNVQISKYATDVYKGNVVGVWQAVMWADGVTFYIDDYSPSGAFTNCMVDGYFGEITADATKWEQQRFGLAMDGIVGTLTWGAVDDFLGWSGDIVVYRGLKRTLYFKRSTVSPGNYSWSWHYSPYRYTGYWTVEITDACP